MRFFFRTPEHPAPKPLDSSDEPVERTPINVTLPPIDATPEEIVQALFRRSSKKPKAEESDESDW